MHEYTSVLVVAVCLLICAINARSIWVDARIWHRVILKEMVHNWLGAIGSLVIIAVILAT